MSDNLPSPASWGTQDTFQRRLNALLDCTNITDSQIERGTRGIVSQHHIDQFRTGRIKNPSYKVLAALSKFFNVPASYFFGDPCDNIAYMLPCIGETGRQRIEKLVNELLEEQLFQLVGQLREGDE